MASNAQFMAVMLLHLCTTSSSLYLGPPRQAHNYLRFADVNRHCQSMLSSATELAYEANRPYQVRHQLSFEKGDWRQDADHAPLLPFVAGDAPKKGARRLPEPLSLATFVVTHVDDDEEHRARPAVNVSGVLVLARKSAAPEFAPGLISYSMYHYQPQELAAGAGHALPSSGADDGVSSRARDVYNGSYPCLVLNRNAYGQVSTVLPGWQCNSTAATGGSCHGIGPFEMDKAADADAFAGVGIIMQDFQCLEQYDMAGPTGTAMVSVVFRALSPWEDWSTARSRSGLSGKTLSAEGVWKTSTGQACMVACRGIAGKKACNFRVCLFFPTTMSITGLDTMLGEITGVDAAAGGVAYPPLLSFRQHMSPPRLWGYYPDDGIPLVSYKYNYAKVNQAGELRRRSELPSHFRKIVAKSLSMRDGAGNDRRSLSSLADRLTLWFMAMPDLFRQEWIERPILHLEVFSLEQVIDRYSPPQHGDGRPTKEPGTEGRILLNVSAELTIFKDRWPQKSVMSLEGVYNPDDGRMHLIGCQDVRLPWQNSSTSRDLGLEQGMDCSIEVKVEYPPTTMHLFVMSTAKVQIASTRTAVDALHFKAVKLRAMPSYPQQRPSGFYRGVVNGVLCIVLLSATIAAVLSQLRYIKTHTDVAPYISLVMLSVQALGYGIPLVTGVEAILARAVKVLTVCAFILTVRLGQKVRRSRACMVERSPLDPACVPSDGRVFVYYCGVHLVLFVLILALNREAMAVEQQVALMQDLFLLPQAIGNAVWRINCRPLKGSFYVGVTFLRLLPHAYEYGGPPADFRSRSVDVNAGSQGRFFAKAGDMVIPLAAVALALVVHAQQRCNYAIVSRMGKPEQKKLHHIF
uniref:RING-type E3 ubiquitin transferase n=1 Tax=Aegilops tauschii TaxID=37682 RepID=N1R4P4_AEGTA